MLTTPETPNRICVIYRSDHLNSMGMEWGIANDEEDALAKIEKYIGRFLAEQEWSRKETEDKNVVTIENRNKAYFITYTVAHYVLESNP
jgi:hypothetical protein